MTNIDLLISKLDYRLRSLHQEQSLVTKAGSLEQGYTSDYIQITKTGGITPGIEFIILDSLSNHFNLYEDDLERQQILAAMTGELKNASSRDLLASTKIIQNTYPSIYLLTQESLTQIKASSRNVIVRVFTALDTRSKLVVGVAVLISATILGAKISSTFNRSPDPNPSTPTTTLATPEQTVAPIQAVVAQQTPSPEQTATTQQAPVMNTEPVITEDRQSGLSALSYQSHCTLLSEQNQSDNIIDDNCSIAQTVDRKNYTLNWTNGEVSNIEIRTDRQAVINGEQATIVQKNSNGITISFSKGKIGWDLKE
jgi:hypothetical protein